jgi:SHS family sialic acid transporter-like MFS transporter
MNEIKQETLVQAADSVSVPWYREISSEQWRVLAGTWAVWTLDSVDYLSITFVLSDIAAAFGMSLGTTSLLLLATYGVRWLGGLLFGSLSDRIGRKLPLLICLSWFTLGAAFTGLSWDFTSLVIVRLLLGFGMAPGFSIGATMVAESWPEKYRALALGILDTGWGVGAIAASLIYGLVYPHFGWRGMFFVGIIPAVLIGLFVMFCVAESPVWLRSRKQAGRVAKPSVTALFRLYPGRVAFLALLMLLLFFGSWPFQGLFPTFLKEIGVDTAWG